MRILTFIFNFVLPWQSTRRFDDWKVLAFSAILALVAGIGAMLVPAGCSRAQAIDLSTDEAVFKQVKKQKNKKFSQDDVCIERLKESARVIVVGFFAYDRGCRFDGVFIDSRYFETGDANLSNNALTALGWKKGKRVQREVLAKLWVEKGLLAFFTVLHTKDKDFVLPQETYKGGTQSKPREFYPPQVITKENGETVVTLWTSVMRRKKEFHEHEFRFSSAGILLKG